MDKTQASCFGRINPISTTVHQLRPSILSKSHSHSSLAHSNRSNNLITSISKTHERRSQVKVNFTYGRSTSHGSRQVGENLHSNQPHQVQNVQKKEKKSFLNVVSKQTLSKQVLQFVYGQLKIPSTKLICQPETQTLSLQKLMQTKPNPLTQVFFKSPQKSNLHKEDNLLVQNDRFENFPSGKIKKSRNNSILKSSQEKIQLSQNSNSIQTQQVHSKAQNINQIPLEIDTSTDKIGNPLQQSSQSNEKKKQNMISEELSWNDTIKFNSQMLHDETSKQTIRNCESTAANLSFNVPSTSQLSLEGKVKNQTQKISQFLLCDEQTIGQSSQQIQYFKLGQFQNTQYRQHGKNIEEHNEKQLIDRQKIVIKKAKNEYQANQQSTHHDEQAIPVFEIKLSDLRSLDKVYLSNQGNCEETKTKFQKRDLSQIWEDTKNRNNDSSNNSFQQDVNDFKADNTLKQFRIPIKQCDKLGQNLEVLGKNIQDLSHTISKFYNKNQPYPKISKPQFIHNIPMKNSKNSQNEITYELPKLPEKCVFESNGTKIQSQNDKQNILQRDSFAKVNDFLKPQNQSEIENRYINQFIECEQANVTYEKDLHIKCDSYPKYKSISIQTQLNQNFQIPPQSQEKEKIEDDFSRQKDTNVQKILTNQQHNTMLGSLQVVETSNQTIRLSNSLQNFYSNPHRSLELSPQISKSIHHQNQEKTKYPESLFPQTKQKAGHQNLSMQSADKTEPHLQQKNPQNPNNKISQLNHILIKTFQKKNSKNKKQENFQLTIQASPQKIQPGLKHYSSSSNRKMKGNTKIQDGQHEDNSSLLNYQLYRNYRNKSLSKRETKLLIDKSKSKIIELPFMQNPVELDDLKVIYPKYIKNKVYYVKG